MAVIHCRILFAEGYEQLEDVVNQFLADITPVKTIVTTQFDYPSGNFVCSIIYTTPV
jgi:hypothetical protein